MDMGRTANNPSTAYKPLDEIRIGLVGAGDSSLRSARGNFVPKVCKLLEQVKVTAVYDIAKKQATEAAGKLEGCHGYGPGEWEAFLDSDINAVMIATPIPFHVDQSVDALNHGLHVLCEVTAAVDLDESKRLAEAADRSDATYTMAENTCFLDEVILFRRMVQDGLLGTVFHGESGYLHDCRFLWRYPDGSLTWRARDFIGRVVYCTHGLGPVIDVLGERISHVASLATPVDLVEKDFKGESNHSMLMRTASGKTVILRVDTVSPQPYQLPFRFQGSKGACEYIYGQDESPRICVNGEHKWEDPKPYIDNYLSDRKDLEEEAKNVGHGSCEYWMMKAWAEALREGRPTPIDVHLSLDYTLPGIMAVQSAKRNGEWVEVPDSRDWVSA